MRVGIVAQRANARAASLAADLRDMLREDGVEVALDEETAAALELDGVEPGRFSADDLVVSIGGDGTFLFAARHAGTTPVLGVNLGEVGFLNAVAPDRAIDAVREAVSAYRERGAVPAREVPRLAATGGDNGESGEGDDENGDDGGNGGDGWRLTPAINEVLVQGAQRGRGGGLHVEVRVDGERYVASHADGVLVSTPTGSTAYNLSEGGPLAHPDVAGLVVTLMCASDPMPSLVVPLDATVTLHVDDADSAVVASDGREQRRIDPPTVVSVACAPESARVAGPGLEFFAALSKLE